MIMNAVKPGTVLKSLNALRNAHGSGASVFGGVCGTRNDVTAQRTAAPAPIVISETGTPFKLTFAHDTTNATTTHAIVPIVLIAENALFESFALTSLNAVTVVNTDKTAKKMLVSSTVAKAASFHMNWFAPNMTIPITTPATVHGILAV